MARRMLIDAAYPEETRVVVLDGNRLEEFDYETEARKQLKGNIYLAKVTRVEPSLQAAFVEYGGNRHGFLAFNEIHPDYYQIPVADREKLIAEEQPAAEADGENGNGEAVDVVGGDEFEAVEPRRSRVQRYKIQEVIKRRQIMLVQVVKEERGNKGAALTTYLSLPGRYCVLMPNTGKGGGISRKITNATDRKRLKSVIEDLKIPEGMAVILRTAGSERSKAEIRRDYDYLLRLWDDIRTTTLESTAPSLIYEEANLIKRAIRDLYSKDIDEILIDGDDGYRHAKDFMKALMPSHARRVQRYKGDGVPVFQRYQVEAQLDGIHSPEVQLRSGGYIVIHQTEALVAIDVNSGRATRERHIEETALKTNLEAAEEVARQVRLRDLAGLIVIDFIDMEESRNNHAVERRFKEALRNDRARIQVGRISHFGLLEMSRQRLRPSLMEISSMVCRHCQGTGFVRSIEWTGLYMLRAIEEEGLRQRASWVKVIVPSEIALFILNQKRKALAEIETRYDFTVTFEADDTLTAPNYRIEVVDIRERAEPEEEETAPPPAAAAAATEETTGDGGRKRRRRRRRPRRDADETASVEAATDDAEADEAEDDDAVEADAEAADEGEAPSHAADREDDENGR
ncbi:MAG: ribonuclease E/G [Alphaproteobacteria bacterium]